MKGSDLRVPRHDPGSARLGRRSSQERSLGFRARRVQQRTRVSVAAGGSMTAGEGGESSFGFADVKPLTDVLLTEVRGELGDRLTAVALYGSVARGEAHRWSDIDLFVVHRGDRETVSEAFLTAEPRLRDQPLARELAARGVPTAPVVIYRSEEDLADTDVVDARHDAPRHPPVRSAWRAPPEAGAPESEARGTGLPPHRAGRRLVVLGPQARSAPRQRTSPCNAHPRQLCTRLVAAIEERQRQSESGTRPMSSSRWPR